jgi:hypothetical protein
MEDFVELAAEAAYNAYCAKSVGMRFAGWATESEHSKNVARAQVRAVLEALVPPDGQMFVYRADKGDIHITRT